jgi:hypothetical protein
MDGVRFTSKTVIGETTGYLLARVCKAHRGSVGDALAEVGLHVGQEMVLLHLWQRDGLTPSGPNFWSGAEIRRTPGARGCT